MLLQPEFAVLQNAEILAHVCGRDFEFNGVRAVGDNPASDLACDVLDFAFEVADTRLVRVVADDVQQAVILEGEIFFGQAGGLTAALYEKAFRDFQLFLFGIPRQAQNFHAILQRLTFCLLRRERKSDSPCRPSSSFE